MTKTAQLRKPRLRRSTTKQYVVEYLRESIVEGHLAPGERLNLQEVAARLDVSMTPVREAFEQVAVEGLIRLDAYKGARVSELSAHEYQEIFLMRVGLEGLAHRLGAERIDSEGCRMLERCLAEMTAATREGDVSRFLVNDRAFHETIFAAAGRQRLAEKIMSLRRAAERYTRAAYRLPAGGMADTVKSHMRILTACRKNDGAKAEALMTDDLRLTYESFARTYAGELGE